jgi:hypothetical protein
MLRAAADRQDSTEKDPVMPGHVISARELLGDLLMDMNEPAQALQGNPAVSGRFLGQRERSFEAALKMAERAGDLAKAKTFYARLVAQTVQADAERLGAESGKGFSCKNPSPTRGT